MSPRILSPLLLTSLLVACVLLVVAAGMARGSYRAWRQGERRTLGESVWSAVLGLGALGCALCVLAGVLMSFASLGGESVDPSQRALLVSERAATGELYVASGVLLGGPIALVAGWRRRGSRRGTAA